MNCTKLFRLTAVTLMTCGLSACGANYVVTNVSSEKMPRVLPAQGIYYSLPKTEVVVGMPVTISTKKTGRYFGKLDDLFNACKAKPGTEADEPYENTATVTYAPGSARIYTRAVPDPAHRYRLNITADAFSSFSHTVELTEAGILSSANTTVGDGVTAAVLSTVEKVVEIAAAVISPIPAAPAGSPLASDAVTPASGQKSKHCADVEQVYDARNSILAAIAAVEAKRENLLLTTGLATPPETIQKALDYLDGLIAEIKATKEYKEMASATSQSESKKIVGIFTVATPAAFSGLTCSTLSSAAEENTACAPDWDIVALPDAAADKKDPLATVAVPGATAVAAPEISNIDGLRAALKSWNVKTSIETTMAYLPVCTPPSKDDMPSAKVEECTPPTANDGEGGYRYRIASVGKITVTGQVTDGPEKVLAKATAPIAQYGPIAQLPSYFGGIEGSIELSVFTDTGAIKKVTVGAKPQSPDTISKFADIGLDQLKARQARKQAEADAEESAEVDALEKEKKLLSLKKDIRDLKKALGDGEEQ